MRIRSRSSGRARTRVVGDCFDGFDVVDVDGGGLEWEDIVSAMVTGMWREV